MALNACSIGIFSQDSNNCHKTSFTRKIGLDLIENLTSTEKECLLWQSNIRKMTSPLDSNLTVCCHHKLLFLSKFTRKQMTCCNIFGIHTGSSKPKGTSVIDLQTAKNLEDKFPEVIPGLKFCPKCLKLAKNTLVENTSGSSESENEVTSSINSLESASHSKAKVTSVLNVVGGSPLKLHGLNNRKKVKACKRKVETVKKRLIADLSIATNLDQSFLDDDIDDAEVLSSKKFKQDSEEYDSMLNSLKSKFIDNHTTYDEKIQILTLLPESWSRSKTVNFFGTDNCSEYAVRKAVETRRNFGILGKPIRKQRIGITDEVKLLVREAYEDDETSRVMPGAKDKVSLGKKTYAQKRLLLCSVKELFNCFVTKHPEAKIKLTSFYSLKPKWCIQPGRSGTHTVCVCAIHQNVVLLCDAINQTYKDFFPFLVCNVQNKICMVHRCQNCPGIDGLQDKLKEMFPNLDDDELVQFQQWQSTDRTQILTLSLPLSDFLQLLAEKLDHLTAHSYIAKAQATYLRHRKDTLESNERLILADFAENYHFIIQDEIQSCHWSKESCTLHPICVYIPCNDVIQPLSLCFISDDLEHDTAFVYYLQSILCNYLQASYPHLIKVEYFSDGCTAQYKNYKNLLNLFFHKSDFGLDATWSFFATSHGKSPCDGIGGVVKENWLMKV